MAGCNSVSLVLNMCWVLGPGLGQSEFQQNQINSFSSGQMLGGGSAACGRGQSSISLLSAHFPDSLHTSWVVTVVMTAGMMTVC